MADNQPSSNKSQSYVWSDGTVREYPEGTKNPFSEPTRREELEDTEYRGQILPFRETKSGEKEFAMPQWMLDTYNAATLPRDVIMDKYKPTGEDIANFALTVGAGGISASSIVDVPNHDALGMFLGVRAKGADKQALAKAMSMESQGVDREEIWKSTGWWKKPDGNWAWEISDHQADINRSAKANLKEDDYVIGPTDEIVDHPELFKNYNNYSNAKSNDVLNDPTSKTILSLDKESVPGQGAYHRPSKSENFNIGERIEATSSDPDILRNILLHELQHSVQNREGWSGGTNPGATEGIVNSIMNSMPDEWHQRNKLRKELSNNGDKIGAERRKELEDQIDSLSEKLTDIDDWSRDMINKYQANSHTMYTSNEGEAIANITANRANLTPEERKQRPPWKDFNTVDKAFDGSLLPKEENLWTSPRQIAPKRMRSFLPDYEGPSMAIRVYHGTPHTFEKFDIDKIGTGEGNQTFGRGLYFAENPGVADHYRKTVSESQPNSVLIDKSGNKVGEPFFENDYIHSKYNSPEENRIMYAKEYTEDPVSFIDEIKRLDNSLRWMMDIYKNAPEGSRERKALINAKAELKSRREVLNKGYKISKNEPIEKPNLLTVDINADPSEFIDWDKPLYNQEGEIGEKIKPYLLTDKEIDNVINYHTKHENQINDTIDTLYNNIESEIEEGNYLPALKGFQMLKLLESVQSSPNAKGDFKQNLQVQDFIKTILPEIHKTKVSKNWELHSPVEADEKAMAFLKALGIKGVKYFDLDSRKAQQGTRNYVVNDDSLVDIKDRKND